MHGPLVVSCRPCAPRHTCLLTVWLAQGVEDVEVHGPVQGADEQGFVGTCGLVGSVDGLGFPVCPVDVVFKQGQCKDVWDVLAQHCGREVGKTQPLLAPSTDQVPCLLDLPPPS